MKRFLCPIYDEECPYNCWVDTEEGEENICNLDSPADDCDAFALYDEEEITENFEIEI